MSIQLEPLQVIGHLEAGVEHFGLITGLWPLYLFKESGKWAYVAVVKLGPRERVPLSYEEYINEGLFSIGEDTRGVSFKSIPLNWTAVLPQNPLGFPILAKGTNNVHN